MSEQTTASELVKLVPVLIGGILALSGGVLGQIVSYRLSRRRDRSSIRRERLEALVKALYAHGEWIKNKETTMLFRRQDHDVPTPLGEAQMLQKLYFPELTDDMISVIKAEVPMVNFINEQRISQMKDLDAWFKAWNPTPFYEAYKTYYVAVDSLVRKCRDQLSRDL